MSTRDRFALARRLEAELKRARKDERDRALNEDCAKLMRLAEDRLARGLLPFPLVPEHEADLRDYGIAITRGGKRVSPLDFYPALKPVDESHTPLEPDTRRGQ
jgi:hypothetical protein